MKIAPAFACAALSALLGCGGTSGSPAASAEDPEAVRASPAGIASLTFLDLGRLGPDQWGSLANLPPGVTAAQAGGVTTYTFQCPAAVSGTLTGTVTVTPGPGGSYALIYDLMAAPAGAAPAWTWTYRGSSTAVVAGASATLTVSEPLHLVYTDNLVPARSNAFDFTASFTATWTAAPRRLALQGSYELNAAGAQVVTGTIEGADPLVWTTCAYPVSGTLDLEQIRTGGGTAQDTATFTGCGLMTLSGAPFPLP